MDDHVHDDFLKKMYSWVYQGLKVLMALHVELQMILVFPVVEVAGEALWLQMVHGVEMVQEKCFLCSNFIMLFLGTSVTKRQNLENIAN